MRSQVDPRPVPSETAAGGVEFAAPKHQQHAAEPARKPREPSAPAQLLLVVLAVCAVLAVHLSILLFVATNARQSGYHDELAEAFRSGQTWLKEQPPAELIASPDPYNVETLRRTGCKPDASYFHGHYFLYFGPVPALILAGLKSLPLVGKGVSHVADAQLAAGFLVIMTILGALLIRSLRRRVFPDAPWWTVAPAVLALGLVYPIPALYARLIFYEAAVAAGQCFFIGGLFWTVLSLTATSGRGRAGNALAAGVFFSLAVGSRISLLLPTALISILFLWAVFRRDGRQGPSPIGSNPDATGHGGAGTGKRAIAQPSTWARRLIVLSAWLVPLMITGVGLAAYNDARFGSVTEFGVRYQVETHQSNYYDIPKGEFTSTSYIWPTFYSYMLRPVLFISDFPFVRCRIGADPLGLPNSYHRSRTFNDQETTAGALLVSPIVWLGLAPVMLGLLGLRRRDLLTRDASARGHTAGSAGTPTWMGAWVILAFGGSSLCAMVPIFLLQAAITRYPADFMPCLTLCGIAGLWYGCRQLAFRPSLRRAFLSLGVCLTLFTALTGAALSANPYFENTAAVRELQNAAAIHWDGREYAFDTLDQPARLIVRVARDGFLMLDARIIAAPQFPDPVPCTVTVSQLDSDQPLMRREVRFTDNQIHWRIPGIKRGDVMVEFDPFPSRGGRPVTPGVPKLHFQGLRVRSSLVSEGRPAGIWDQPPMTRPAR
jgi:hypothetical protein